MSKCYYKAYFNDKNNKFEVVEIKDKLPDGYKKSNFDKHNFESYDDCNVYLKFKKLKAPEKEKKFYD